VIGNLDAIANLPVTSSQWLYLPYITIFRNPGFKLASNQMDPYEIPIELSRL